ncbi:hypothetical protein [Lichenicola sp.]|uniref:hypothetical protein n=1 Tax=Lichenicola sp. TaxID=2804529 RepID=UPI003B0070B8
MKLPSLSGIPALPKGPQLPAQNFASPSGPKWLGSKADQAKALKAAGQDKVDNYDIAMQAVSIVLGTVDAEAYKEPIKTIGYGLQAGVDSMKGIEASGGEALKKLSKKRNPFFDQHDVEIGQTSPVTQDYLSSRRWKKMGGSAVQAFGTLSSLIPHMVGVNVTGAVYHGDATRLTAHHMAKVGYIAAKYSDQKEVQDFCRLVEAAKAAKLSIRGAQLVGSIIPLASLPTTIAAAALKAGIKLTSAGACYAAASAIHWKAYEEQGYFEEIELQDFTLPPVRPTAPLTMAPSATGSTGAQKPLPPIPKPLPPLPPKKSILGSRGGAGAGPASGIFWEIFTKRGATRAFGKYDIQALVKEPAGWMALADKLLLI